MENNLTITFRDFMSSKSEDTFSLNESTKLIFDDDDLLGRYDKIVKNNTKLFGDEEKSSEFYKVLFNLVIKKMRIEMDNYLIKDNIPIALKRTNNEDIENNADFDETDVIDNIFLMLEEVLPNIELK